MVNKVEIGDIYHFRDCITSREAVVKVIDGEEFVCYKQNYDDYYVRIKDCEDNRELFASEIDDKKYCVVEVETNLPSYLELRRSSVLCDDRGSAYLCIIGVPSKCLKSKEEMAKFFNDTGLGIAFWDSGWGQYSCESGVYHHFNEEEKARAITFHDEKELTAKIKACEEHLNEIDSFDKDVEAYMEANDDIFSELPYDAINMVKDAFEAGWQHCKLRHLK